MNKIFQVSATITSFVEAIDENHARQVASNERNEIIGDFDGALEVGYTVQSLEEMNALDERGNWDGRCFAYGHTSKPLGQYFEDLADFYENGGARCPNTVDMFDGKPDAAPAADAVASPPFWYEEIARKKVGGDPDWKAAIWQACKGHDSLIEGAVPRVGLDGKPRWIGIELDKVVVTDAELRQAKLDYETETGKCCKCAGSGKEFGGWDHITGNKYRDCVRCGATGKAPVVSQ